MSAVVPYENIERGADWLRGGPEGDVVISSRVRLARNLAGVSFPGRMSGAESTRLMRLAQQATLDIHPPVAEGAQSLLANKLHWVQLSELAALDRMLLVERHLVSREHAKSDRVRALLLSLPDERHSIMVNEEDHLRMQCVMPGLALGQAWAAINDVDDQFEEQLDFAYLPRLGYLTACPTNVGCGARLSVMLHLPASRLSGELERVKRAAKDMNLTLRGFYGEGSDGAGDLYQISNQTTLGRSEEQLREMIELRVVPQIVAFERKVRDELLRQRSRYFEDQIFRSFGTLRSARLLTPEEAMAGLSLVRLGVVLGLITGLSTAAVTQLMLLCQPAHLQRLLHREMDQQARREARADLVRHRLVCCNW